MIRRFQQEPSMHQFSKPNHSFRVMGREGYPLEAQSLWADIVCCIRQKSFTIVAKRNHWNIVSHLLDVLFKYIFHIVLTFSVLCFWLHTFFILSVHFIIKREKKFDFKFYNFCSEKMIKCTIQSWVFCTVSGL